MKGNLFNIQKFSIHDGPGLRTTVFFKGCPLHCRWCSNPESQSFKTLITWDDRKCLHCGSCVAACPRHCISLSEKGEKRIRIDPDRCTGCRQCVTSCPGRALNFEGEWKELDDVVFECLQDLDFYEESGGGVTFSGGECFCQPEFAAALLCRLKEHGIHVAAETTGCVSPETFQKLAPLFDLLLFDVKHCDSAVHKEQTGASLELITQNLIWARQQGLNILCRIPVIPGFNASTKDAARLAEHLLLLGFARVQLLPFHQMGERKYDLLGKDYSMKGEKAFYPETLSDYRKQFLDRGIDAFF